jgi:hypothetical protein
MYYYSLKEESSFKHPRKHHQWSEELSHAYGEGKVKKFKRDA